MKIEKDLTIRTEDDEEITVEVTYLIEEDGDYGSDADGNRGIYIAWIEDVSFCAPDQTDDGRRLSPEEVDLYTARITERAHDQDAAALVAESA